MVASSNAVAAASLQNSQEYSGKGRSRWARAMKRAAISIAAGAKKAGNKKLFKNGKTKTREEKRRFFLFRFAVLSGSWGSKERGDTEILQTGI